MSAAAGARCCPAFRARCAGCSPTRSSAASAAAGCERSVTSFARERFARRASRSRSSPGYSARWPRGRRRTLARVSARPGRRGPAPHVRGIARPRDRRARRWRRVTPRAAVGVMRMAKATPISRRSCSTSAATAGSHSRWPRAAPAGLLGARLTAVAGSSDVVAGGVIAYSQRREARSCSGSRRRRSTNTAP